MPDIRRQYFRREWKRKDLFRILPILSDLEVVNQHIPAEGCYDDRRIDGMSVLVADMDAQRKYLRDTLKERE